MQCKIKGKVLVLVGFCGAVLVQTAGIRTYNGCSCTARELDVTEKELSWSQ
jgi:hypothetical protein